MKQLAIIFILVLASTTASKYFRPEHQFQQVPRDKYQELLLFDDDRLLSKLSPEGEMTKWESPPDPRMLFDLESLENYLQDDSNDFRIKRTKTSLSIDNPLDVLRQQYFRALARRMKYKSIEKNREHLLKTGKRSPKDSQYQIKLSKQSEYPTSQKEFIDNGLEESRRHLIVSSEQNPTSRAYQNRLDDVSYQT